LNHNHLVGGYKGDSLANRTAGGKHMNLTSLLKTSNILDEDGIEDLHFYFVSFSQHKQGILKLQERIEKPSKEQQPRHKKGKSVPPQNRNGSRAMEEEKVNKEV
jgi:hypothetical protein